MVRVSVIQYQAMLMEYVTCVEIYLPNDNIWLSAKYQKMLGRDLRWLDKTAEGFVHIFQGNTKQLHLYLSEQGYSLINEFVHPKPLTCDSQLFLTEIRFTQCL